MKAKDLTVEYPPFKAKKAPDFTHLVSPSLKKRIDEWCRETPALRSRT